MPTSQCVRQILHAYRGPCIDDVADQGCPSHVSLQGPWRRTTRGGQGALRSGHVSRPCLPSSQCVRPDDDVSLSLGRGNGATTSEGVECGGCGGWMPTQHIHFGARAREEERKLEAALRARGSAGEADDRLRLLRIGDVRAS